MVKLAINFDNVASQKGGFATVVISRESRLRSAPYVRRNGKRSWRIGKGQGKEGKNKGDDMKDVI